VDADIRRGSSWRGRQTTVGLSTMATLGELGCHFFSGVVDQ